MFDELKKAIDTFGINIPHASNISTQISRDLSETKKIFFSELEDIYIDILNSAANVNDEFDDWITLHSLKVEEYIAFLTSNTGIFSHQTDFKSSVIPELICIIFNQILVRDEIPNVVLEAQKDIIIELMFSHVNGGIIYPKWKRVDSALLIPKELVFGGFPIENFSIPIVAVEVKTNLDKNMITGIEHSVSQLKSTFPLCQYFVISEFADFNIEEQNYASTDIDEIIILRNQKRSEYRRSGNANNINVDLLKMVAINVKESLARMTTEVIDVQSRFSSGYLIQNY